jgi:hypothetical protein
MLNEFLGTQAQDRVGLSGQQHHGGGDGAWRGDGVTNSWDSWKSLNPTWLTEKKINHLVQTEPKARDLDIPSVQELARNDEDRQVIALIISGDALGKPLALTPNVPPERVKALRDALTATVKDPEFIKAAAAARIEVNPIRGEGAPEHRKQGAGLA